jgi:hypothetical protein
VLYSLFNQSYSIPSSNPKYPAVVAEFNKIVDTDKSDQLDQMDHQINTKLPNATVDNFIPRIRAEDLCGHRTV